MNTLHDLLEAYESAEQARREAEHAKGTAIQRMLTRVIEAKQFDLVKLDLTRLRRNLGRFERAKV